MIPDSPDDQLVSPPPSILPMPHALIQSANEDIDKICKEIYQINKANGSKSQDTIEKLENQSKKIAAVISRLEVGLEVEGEISHVETVARKVRRLKTLLANTQEAVSQTIEGSQTGRRDKIDLKNRLHILSQQALALEGLNRAALERVKILENRTQWRKGEQPLLRFDRWLQDANLSDEEKGQLREIIINKLYQKNGKISEADLTFLKGLLSQEQNIFRNAPQDNRDFVAFISETLQQCEEASTRKTQMLNELVYYYSISSKTENDKLKFLVCYRQIVNNPFEPPVEATYVTTDELSELIKKNQNTPINPSKEVLGYKIEGLRLIRRFYPDPDLEHPVLIAGAGPGGLMAGLIASMQGKTFRILEARSKKDSTTRKNILALGKGAGGGAQGSHSLLPMMQGLQPTGRHLQADLRLLDFFGVTDRLIVEHRAFPPPDQTAILCASIGDIQDVMVKQIQAVTEQEEVIQYGKVIQKIQRGSSGAAEVVIASSGRKGIETGDTEIIQPQAVYVMEGARSPTRTLLGIQMVKQSTAAKMAFAFFKAKEARGLGTRFMHKLEVLSEHVRAIPTLFRVAWRVLMASRQGRNQVEAAFQVYDRGSLLLRTPTSDYLYYTINKQDEEQFKTYEKNLEDLKTAFEDWRLQIFQDLKKFSNQENEAIKKAMKRIQEPDCFIREERSKTLRLLADAAQVMGVTRTAKTALQTSKKALQQTQRELEHLERMQTEMQKKMAGEGRRLFGLVNPFQNVSARAAQYQRTDLGASQVQRADRNCQYVGQTPFILCGDAESTTDPLSGGGLRYTLQRTALAASALERVSQNRFARSAFEFASHLSTRAMREEGLEMRQRAVKGTERLERYLDAAADEGVLKEWQCQEFLSLHAKFEAGFPLKTEETAALKKFLGVVKNRYFSRDPIEHTIQQWSIQAALTPDERVIIQRIHSVEYTNSTTGVFEELRLTDREMASLRRAAAKLALVRTGLKGGQEKYYISGAWFFLLAAITEQMLAASKT